MKYKKGQRSRKGNKRKGKRRGGGKGKRKSNGKQQKKGKVRGRGKRKRKGRVPVTSNSVHTVANMEDLDQYMMANFVILQVIG